MDASLRELVRRRAGNRCEYCHIRQEHDPLYTFPVDHIVARQHGGATVEDNLCLSCYRCNAHKGPNIASIDPVTQQIVRLFHPQNDRWAEHFEWAGAVLVGRAAIGRATIGLLSINHPDCVTLREVLIEEG